MTTQQLSLASAAPRLPFAGSHLARPNVQDARWIPARFDAPCWHCGATVKAGHRIYWQSAKSAAVRDDGGRSRSPVWCAQCATKFGAPADSKAGEIVDPATLGGRTFRGRGHNTFPSHSSANPAQHQPSAPNVGPLGPNPLDDEHEEQEEPDGPEAPIAAPAHQGTPSIPAADELAQQIAQLVRGALKPAAPVAPALDVRKVEEIARRLDSDREIVWSQSQQSETAAIRHDVAQALAEVQSRAQQSDEHLANRIDIIERTKQNGPDEATLRRIARDEAGAALVVAVGKVAGDPSQLAAVGAVPPAASDYVQTETGRLVRWCLQAGHHALVSGPSGSGKTYPIEQECAALGRAVVKVSCSDGLSRRALVVGEHLVKANGSTVTQARYGALPLAMRAGAVLILDECDKIQPELAAVFHAPLETPISRAALYIPETGETILPAPGFLVLCTSNMVRDVTGNYSGHRIDAALVNRCRAIPADYLAAAQEQSIIEKAGATPRLALQIVDFLTRCRAFYTAGNLTSAPSTRVGVVLAQMVCGLGADGTTAAPGLTVDDAVTLTLAGALTPAEAAQVREAAKQARIGA